MTNAEARSSKSFSPRKREGSLRQTAQDVHFDSHRAPELLSITCLQPLSRCSLTLIASSFSLESVVFLCFPPSFSPCVLSFSTLVYWPFRTRLNSLIRAAVFLLSSAFVYIPMLCHRSSSLAFCFISLKPLFF